MRVLHLTDPHLFAERNGSLRGAKHCTDIGCLMVNGHCVRTVHAEANALVQAARHGIRLEGAEIYVTASPCFDCFKLIANAGRYYEPRLGTEAPYCIQVFCRLHRSLPTREKDNASSSLWDGVLEYMYRFS